MNGPTTPPGLDVTPERVALAVDWHGGQASMLYAVASVGRLECGSRRPDRSSVEHGWHLEGGEWVRRGRFGGHGITVSVPLTDAEWLYSLVEQLEREVRHCALIASDPDNPDAYADLEALEAWQQDLEAWLEDNDPEDRPTLCDRCGTPCDALDAWTDGTLVLCGSLRGNGCDATLEDDPEGVTA